MLPNQSSAMRLAWKAGLEPLAWSLRRLHCPVSPEALVLEVGSGGNPYPRANVLLDAYEATRHRHWVPLVSDRPTVLGRVEALPFRDGAFDFVIASHVLEHSADPERFLGELQRVARAGYIEVPDAFMERVNPYRDHRLEITVRDGRLRIRKKPDWRTDPDLVELYEHRAKRTLAGQLIPKHPFDFHVRYYWQSGIDFEVLNPDQSADWRPPEDDRAPSPATRRNWRQAALAMLRWTCSQRQRNRQIELVKLLHCVDCGATPLIRKEDHLLCGGCSRRYELRRGIPIMHPSEAG